MNGAAAGTDDHAMHVVATAGHVDHGKSALARALTGQEPDRLAEERRRGLTIDLGFVWTDLADGDRRATVAFVDVPGHDRFLTNMLTGVGAVDEVLFVVAADDGWSAQSEEHLQIVSLLGRRITAAVVTKTDPAGPARSAAVVADVTERLAAAGHLDTPVLAVDALAGTGLDTLRTTLLDRLSPRSAAHDAGCTAPHDAPPDLTPRDGFARLWVDRVFTVAGAGTVATGTLTSGTLRRGQHVTALPGGARGRIRELRALDEPREQATAPARVAVALAGVDHDGVTRGDVLVEVRGDDAPSALASCHLDVWVTTLPDATVTATGAWQLHLGTAHREVRVLPLLGDIAPAQSGPVRLRLATPVPARIGDRLVLREVGQRRTVAGGVVLDVDPGPPPRGVDRRLTYADALDTIRTAGDTIGRVAGLLAAHGGAGELAHLEAMVGRALAEVSGPDQAVARPTPAAGTGTHAGAATSEADPVTAGTAPSEADPVIRLDGQLVLRAAHDRWVDALLQLAADADEPACTHDGLRRAARAAGAAAGSIEALLRAAIDDGRLHDVGGRLVHADRLDAYRAARERRQHALLAQLQREPFAAEPIGQHTPAAGVPWFEVQPLLDAGELFVRDGLLFASASLEHAVARLDAGPARDGAGFTASEARRCWDVSRRIALPLLEQLRASGRTRFDGTLHHRLVDAHR